MKSVELRTQIPIAGIPYMHHSLEVRDLERCSVSVKTV